MEPTKYIHTEETHNLDAPREIVPVIMQFIEPASVVDVGCGIGTFLYVFKQAGVKNVLGIDGHWADKNLVSKYLSEGEFMEADFEKPFNTSKKFDLGICLEVAEHLSEASADAFVKNLTTLSDVFLFSAAIPNQGGQNHLNEQWPKYWEEKFNKQGFEFHDVLRAKLWNNNKIFWWYRQNMFIVCRKGYQLNLNKLQLPAAADSLAVVHPNVFDYYSAVANLNTKKLELIEEGGYSIKVYFQLLQRAIRRKLSGSAKGGPVLVFNKENPLQK